MGTLVQTKKPKIAKKPKKHDCHELVTGCTVDLIHETRKSAKFSIGKTQLIGERCHIWAVDASSRTTILNPFLESKKNQKSAKRNNKKKYGAWIRAPAPERRGSPAMSLSPNHTQLTWNVADQIEPTAVAWILNDEKRKSC